MKGLWVKDLLILASQWKLLIGFILIAGLNGVISGGGSNIFVFFFMVFFFMSLATTLIAYEQQNNGYDYLFTLPIKRSTYIWEKQLIMVALAVFASVISIIVVFILSFLEVSIIFNLTNLLYLAFGATLFGCFYGALAMPLIIRFGSENGRIVMFGMVALFIVGGVLVEKTNLFSGILQSGWFQRITQLTILPFAGLILILMALIILISAFASQRSLKSVLN